MPSTRSCPWRSTSPERPRRAGFPPGTCGPMDHALGCASRSPPRGPGERRDPDPCGERPHRSPGDRRPAFRRPRTAREADGDEGHLRRRPSADPRQSHPDEPDAGRDRPRSPRRPGPQLCVPHGRHRDADRGAPDRGDGAHRPCRRPRGAAPAAGRSRPTGLPSRSSRRKRKSRPPTRRSTAMPTPRTWRQLPCRRGPCPQARRCRPTARRPRRAPLDRASSGPQPARNSPRTCPLPCRLSWAASPLPRSPRARRRPKPTTRTRRATRRRSGSSIAESGPTALRREAGEELGRREVSGSLSSPED